MNACFAHGKTIAAPNLTASALTHPHTPLLRSLLRSLHRFLPPPYICVLADGLAVQECKDSPERDSGERYT